MYIYIYIEREIPCGVRADVLDCGIRVSELELPLLYNVQFRNYTLKKSMNPVIPPLMLG